jgi:uncharacterized Ntn-hydrolase superfamily protein
VRQRWFGATGRRVPEIAVEGDPRVPLEGALVVDDVTDVQRLEQAHRDGTPVVVRASDAEQVKQALSRPEVACVLVPPGAEELLDLDLRELTYGGPVSTYSIVACDLDAGHWGVAVQSKFLAVGSIVPWAEPHVGAVATQSYANPRYGPDGLALLREGRSAEEVVRALVGPDEGRSHRQVGVVDGRGGSATYTGEECLEWAGGRTGPGYAAQGNILVSQETVDALADTFEATSGQLLAERLLDCLAAAQAAGGDRRGQQSAALLVVEKDGGYAGLSDTLVELRVDDHERPIEELRRLYGIHQKLFGHTARDEWLSVDDTLATELRERLGRLGYDGGLEDALTRWAGTENLEERVEGVERIDPVVLAELRSQTGELRDA